MLICYSVQAVHLKLCILLPIHLNITFLRQNFVNCIVVSLVGVHYTTTGGGLYIYINYICHTLLNLQHGGEWWPFSTTRWWWSMLSFSPQDLPGFYLHSTVCFYTTINRKARFITKNSQIFVSTALIYFSMYAVCTNAQ